MPTRYIGVPRGTPPRKCFRCPATIYLVKNPKTERRMPIDCEPYAKAPESRAPTSDQDGKGVSHFATCPEAASFRRSR